MPRLFAAIRPPAEVRETLRATMGAVPGARWLSDDQLHLTLAFLGEVDARDGDALVDRLEAVRCAPIALGIDGVGHFERKGAPVALWARVVPDEALARLQKRVALACRRAGIAPDARKFLPHVTLARLGRSAGPIGRWLVEHDSFGAGPWQAGEFVLYESHLRPEGPLYDPLVRFALRA
jgi:2'-5' RNA ligase